MNIKRFVTCCLAVVSGLGLATISVAQEETVQGGAVEVDMTVVDGQGLAAPMIFAARTESVDGAPARMQIFSGEAMAGMSFMNSGLPGMSGAPDPFSLIGDPSVQKDLELVDDQLKSVLDLQKDFQMQMKEQIGDLSKGGINPDRFKGLGQLIKNLREQQKSQMEELLLPHQIERLQQVALQKHMERAGAAGALASEKLAEELGITDEQKEKLKERQAEIKKGLAEKIAKLQDDAREELLQELTLKQRDQLKQMMGDKFKSVPNDWNERVKQNFQMRRKAEPSSEKRGR